MKKNKQPAAEPVDIDQPQEEPLEPIESLPAGRFAELSRSLLRRSQYNPRKRFDEEKLASLAGSIREKGIIEPLVVRPLPDPDGDAICYEIVAGERRDRAAEIAGLEAVPVIIRELTDAQALEIALIENVEREDIDPIEEAAAYKGLAELGYKQEDIARRVHKDRSVIANRMRLLELPENVQTMISNGELSPTHGIHLVRYAKWPEICAVIATVIGSRSISVADMDSYLPAANELQGKGLITSFGYGGEDGGFEKSVCQECPFGAYVKLPRGSRYCFKPDHFKELCEEEDRKREERRQAGLRAAQEQLEKQRQEAEKAAAEAKLEGTTAAPAPSKGKKSNKPAKPTLDASQAIDLTQLSYNDWKDLTYETPPAGCSKDCPCRGVGVTRQGSVINACLQPKRYQSLVSAVTRKKNDEKRTRLENRRTRVFREWQKNERTRALSIALVALVWPALSSCHASEIKAAASAENMTFDDVDLSKVFVTQSYYLAEEVIRPFWVELAKYEFERIFRFAMNAIANHELGAAVTSYQDKMRMLDWLAVAMAFPMQEIPTEEQVALPLDESVDTPASDDTHAQAEPAAQEEPESQDGPEAEGPMPSSVDETPESEGAPASLYACCECDMELSREQAELSSLQCADHRLRCDDHRAAYLTAANDSALPPEADVAEHQGEAIDIGAGEGPDLAAATEEFEV